MLAAIAALEGAREQDIAAQLGCLVEPRQRRPLGIQLVERDVEIARVEREHRRHVRR
ncbi:MAG: hypothetical protein H7138_01620 [Myxococcales bacterium]|nr:hypothetical protein [Myxococcales bacterium]